MERVVPVRVEDESPMRACCLPAVNACQATSAAAAKPMLMEPPLHDITMSHPAPSKPLPECAPEAGPSDGVAYFAPQASQCARKQPNHLMPTGCRHLAHPSSGRPAWHKLLGPTRSCDCILNLELS